MSQMRDERYALFWGVRNTYAQEAHPSADDFIDCPQLAAKEAEGVPRLPMGGGHALISRDVPPSNINFFSISRVRT